MTRRQTAFASAVGQRAETSFELVAQQRTGRMAPPEKEGSEGNVCLNRFYLPSIKIKSAVEAASRIRMSS